MIKAIADADVALDRLIITINLAAHLRKQFAALVADNERALTRHQTAVPKARENAP